jgi:hypothetical protein
MPLTPEQRRARAQLTALCRWHGKDTTLTDAVAARLERAALDRRIDELLAEAPRDDARAGRPAGRPTAVGRRVVMPGEPDRGADPTQPGGSGVPAQGREHRRTA